MKVVDPAELISGFRRVDLSTATPMQLRGVLNDIRRVRARFDGVEAEIARRLKTTSPTPERDIAASAQRSNRHGTKVLARAAALADTPPLRTDRATGTWRLSGTFDPETGARIHGRIEAAMAAMFATKTPSTTPTDPGEKQDHLRALALLALTTGGATSKTKSDERDPKTAPRDNNTNNTETGNTNNSETGNTNNSETGNSRGTGENNHPGNTTEPDQAGEPDEWDHYTKPLGTATKRFGRPEFTIVIDTTNLDPDGHPTVDWGIPIAVPWTRIRDLSRNADIRPVIVRDGAIIDADGELNLGRTTRLANRTQRRALRVLYATCAVPGCNVTFNHTKPHHIRWWRHGGPTDLANLLPLCSQHHHAAHEGGWRFTLGLDRSLTIELPNGQTMHTGPPRRQQAAA